MTCAPSYPVLAHHFVVDDMSQTQASEHDDKPETRVTFSWTSTSKYRATDSKPHTQQQLRILLKRRCLQATMHPTGNIFASTWQYRLE